ncbi:DUF2231 domain-containing protein [Erythrobacter aureus]|uniref:DUF2231 domain-containing protein n=1 Tax=Erythrobacter aureus TaxID=2182384 RepID=UPI003A8E80C1
MKLVLSALLAALLFAGPATGAFAHEAHQQDMSDAEMAAIMASTHGEAAASIETGATATSETLDGSAVSQAVEDRSLSLSDVLGRLHPFAAHFPIALLLTAFLAELVLLVRPALGLETSVRVLVAGGALGATFAAVLGWFAAGWRLTDRSETLGLHRWNGTAIAIVSLIAWWAASRPSRTPLRALLALLAAAILYQGYLGGEMVFGPNHLGL